MSTDKPSRNEDEYFAQQNADLIRQQRAAAEKAALEAERRSHYMKCPKDGYDLNSVQHQGVQIETCPHCGGMWLDAGELEAVAKEDRPGLLTRVLTDAFSSLRSSPRRGEPTKPPHDPANPLS